MSDIKITYGWYYCDSNISNYVINIYLKKYPRICIKDLSYFILGMYNDCTRYKYR